MLRSAATILSVALLGVVLAPGPAQAGHLHPSVVQPNPVNVTPNVTDAGLPNNSAVFAINQLGGTMYAGGRFRTVTNATHTQTYNRTNVMAFDAVSGAMTSFAPVVNGDVWAIQPSGSSVYIAGAFSSVNGIPRRGIAKLDATTGVVDLTFDAHLTGGTVFDAHLVGGRLIISGNFAKRMQALNPSTGANTGYINLPITGRVSNGSGATNVYRFAVNPTGDRLVAVGNFTSVGGQARSRAFMLDLGATSATVDPWYYQPLSNMCAAASLPSYLKDVDFSPDGSYFVIASTGFVPQSGGIGRDVCDAAARFETAIANPFRPTWINYTGGDTLHSVIVTGAAVYVNGHQRWLDNPFGRDNAGTGAVSRPGIGAIDPVTGKALSWNPGKTRGVGGKDLYASATGLWVASDGARFANELRDNIAFCPL